MWTILRTSSGSASDTQAFGLVPSEQVPESSGDGSCKKREENKNGSLFMEAVALNSSVL